jgi:hypothetical protein
MKQIRQKFKFRHLCIAHKGILVRGSWFRSWELVRAPKKEDFNLIKTSRLELLWLKVRRFAYTLILARVGYVTRQITSRRQGCSEYLLYAHSYTLKYNYLHWQCHLASGQIFQYFHSRPVPLYQLYADSVEDTTRQGSISRVQQPLLRERFVSSVVTQRTFYCNRGYSC